MRVLIVASVPVRHDVVPVGETSRPSADGGTAEARSLSEQSYQLSPEQVTARNRIYQLASGLSLHGAEVLVSGPTVTSTEETKPTPHEHEPQPPASSLWPGMDRVVMARSWTRESQEELITGDSIDAVIYATGWSHCYLSDKALSNLRTKRIPLYVDLAEPSFLAHRYDAEKINAEEKLRVFANTAGIVVTSKMQQLYYYGWLVQAGRVPEQPFIHCVPFAYPGISSTDQPKDKAHHPRFLLSGDWTPGKNLSQTVLQVCTLVRDAGRGSVEVLGSPRTSNEVAGDARLLNTRASIHETYALVKAIARHTEGRIRIAEQSTESLWHRALEQATVAVECMPYSLENELASQNRIIEYLSSGVAVVCPSHLPISQRIWEYEAGWVIEQPSGKEFEMTIQEILNAPQAVEARRANALRLAQDRFSIKRTVEPLFQLCSAKQDGAESSLRGTGSAASIQHVRSSTDRIGKPSLGQVTPRPPLFRASGVRSTIGLSRAAPRLIQRFIMPGEGIVALEIPVHPLNADTSYEADGSAAAKKGKQVRCIVSRIVPSPSDGNTNERQINRQTVVDKSFPIEIVRQSEAITLPLKSARGIRGGEELDLEISLVRNMEAETKRANGSTSESDGDLDRLDLESIVHPIFPMLQHASRSDISGAKSGVEEESRLGVVAISFVPPEISSQHQMQLLLHRGVGMVQRGEWNRIYRAVSRRVSHVGTRIRGGISRAATGKYHLWFLVLSLLPAFSLAGCILPPDTESPQVLSAEELTDVSALERGRSFALAGRADLAEIEFRRVISRNPSFGNAYSNLGFILQNQARLDEAIEAFGRAVQLDPNNLTARDGLARAYYRHADYSKAAKEFDQLLARYFRLDAVKDPSLGEHGFANPRIAGVYRNLSGINFTVGALDEASCYSQIATELDASDYQLALHLRLLLAMDQATRVIDTIKGPVLGPRIDSLPPLMLMDYGIARYAIGDIVGASEAFAKVLSAPEITPGERGNVVLLQLLALKMLGRNEEASYLTETVLEDYPDLCDPQAQVIQDYWPQKVFEDMTALTKNLCPTLDSATGIF